MTNSCGSERQWTLIIDSEVRLNDLTDHISVRTPGDGQTEDFVGGMAPTKQDEANRSFGPSGKRFVCQSLGTNGVNG